MADRQILFSGAMVRAILARPPLRPKTQTRRVLVAPKWSTGVLDFELGDDGVYAISKDTGCLAKVQTRIAVGDRLWVRETVRAEELEDGTDGVRYLADDAFVPIENTAEAGERWVDLNHYRGQRGATVPAIHMPRWCSRISLDVTNVRVERLQDIAEDDALAEGIVCEKVTIDVQCYGGMPEEITADRFWNGTEPDGFEGWENAIDAYAALWDHINGDGAWQTNPFVVAYTFNRSET